MEKGVWVIVSRFCRHCLSANVHTLMETVPAMIPSTVDSVNGSNRRSCRRIKSGFRRYPLRALYSKMPRLSCIPKSAPWDKSLLMILHSNWTRILLPLAKEQQERNKLQATTQTYPMSENSVPPFDSLRSKIFAACNCSNWRVFPLDKFDLAVVCCN